MEPTRQFNPHYPNTFYKNDPKSNAELATRAQLRGQSYNRPVTISDSLSDSLGYEASEGTDSLSAVVKKRGKVLDNINATSQGVDIRKASSRSMPISGTRLGVMKGIMSGKRIEK